MTDPRPDGHIETSPTGVGGWAIRGRFGLPPLGVDVAVAVVVFGASAVNVATQDGVGISAIPVAGFVMLAISSVGSFPNRDPPRMPGCGSGAEAHNPGASTVMRCPTPTVSSPVPSPLPSPATFFTDLRSSCSSTFPAT